MARINKNMVVTVTENEWWSLSGERNYKLSKGETHLVIDRQHFVNGIHIVSLEGIEDYWFDDGGFAPASTSKLN